MFPRATYSFSPSLVRSYTTEAKKYPVNFLSKEYTIYSLAQGAIGKIDIDLSTKRTFLAMSMTPKEFVVIAENNRFHTDLKIIKSEGSWGAAAIVGSIPFEVSGVLDSVISPLTANKMSLLAYSTFSSDYFFFKKSDSDIARQILCDKGFLIAENTTTVPSPLSSSRDPEKIALKRSDNHNYRLKISKKEFAIYSLASEKLDKIALPLPDRSSFVSFSMTPKELTIIAERDSLESDDGIIAVEAGWNAVYIDSFIPPDATGVLNSLINPLSLQKISLLAYSTFDSDYLFFKGNQADLAYQTLKAAGFSVAVEE